VVALTDAATIAVDASLGNVFRVTLGGSRTVAAPANPQEGQSIRFELKQDATGSRVITWTSTAGGFSFGGGSAPTLTTTAAKTDSVRFTYNSVVGKWLYDGSNLAF
jgi:membrane protein YqaA with SNARE-associated domain